MKDMGRNEIRRALYTDGLRVEERADGSPSRTITGYAIIFGKESEPLYQWDGGEDREVISPKAVTRELLDSCDILMTLFHDRQLILARSRGGEGTLSYRVDGTGVGFRFDAPNTADGDKALELVRRGDITGCSFAFSTFYGDSDYVTVTSEQREEGTVTLHTVERMTGVYDFTLTPSPAYPDTSCEARELLREMREAGTGAKEEARAEEPQESRAEDTAAEIAAQVAEMRAAAEKGYCQTI